MQHELGVEACLRALNEGRFDVRAEASSDSEDAEMASLVNQLTSRLQALSSEMNLLKIDLADEGRFGGQMEIPDAQGEWLALANKANAISRTLTVQLRGIARVITSAANGDFSLQLTMGSRGEIKELEDTINVMGAQFSKLASEITRVVREVGAGQPCEKIEVPGLAGTWKDLAVDVETMAADVGLLSRESSRS